MSQAVDSKVVELSFDNQQFEQGCQTSMSTLDKLKQALKFDNAKNGLDEVANTANKMNLGGLGGAVETVQAKFSALDVMAMTALSNITNKAVDTGEKLVKAFTIDPVKDGFAEYELKMDSVQTIMAGSGASVEEVNGYLNELNAYSDKTIYSFKDMTASIGKFTNAGVELGTAVDAIQGIANEAARSGANANEASRAMYNFSQALSTGSVKLIDWKSIENANMATVEFKQQLIDTAVALGTVVKDGDQFVSTTTNLQGKVSNAFDAVSDFNGSLAHQWLTADVLTQTLSNYAKNVDEMTESEKAAYEESLMEIYKDEEKVKAIEELGRQSSKAATEVKTFSMMMDALKEAVGSGWAQTFELIFGNLDEAKEMWTSVNDVLGKFIGDFSDARNKLLQGWKVFGGRTIMLKALGNAFEGLKSVIKPVAEAFRDIFPPATARGLVKLTAAFHNFTKRMKLSETGMENLKNTFRGIFSVISLVVKAFGLITKAIFPAQTATGGLIEAILKVTGAIGNVIANTIQWAESSGLLQSIISGIASVAVPAFNTIKKVVSDAVTSLKEFASKHISVPDFSGFNSAGDVFTYIWESAKKLLDKVPSIEEMGKKIKEAFENIQGSLGGAKEKGAGAIDKVAGLFNSLLGGKPDELKTQAKESTKSFGEGIMEGLSSIDINKVLSGAKFGLLVYIVAQIAGILKNVRQLTGGFSKAAGELKKIPKQVTGILDKVKGTMVSMQNDIRASILLKIAAAIALLTISILALSMVPSDKLANVAVDLALIIGVVAILAAVIGNILNKKADEDENPLVGVLDKFLTGIKKAAKKAMSIVSKAAAFALVAAAVGILAATFIKLAKMKDDLNGVVAATILMVAISVLLVQLVKHLNAVSDKIDAKTGVAIFLIATAIGKLAKTLVLLSGLSLGELAMGVLGLAGILTMFGIFAKQLASVDLTKAGAGLGILTLSILALTPVIILLGSLSEVAMAGVVVVGLLGAVMSGLAALAGLVGDKFGDKMMKGIGGMALLGLTISLLAPTLVLLGTTAPIAGKGILVLAGALAVLLAAGAVAGIPLVTDGLLTLSATLISFGASMLMAGAGVILFAKGLQILLVVAGVVIAAIAGIFLGIKAGVEHLPELASSIINGLANIASFVGEAIMAFGPVILAKIEELIAQLPGWLLNEFPKIVAGIVALYVRIMVTIGNLFVSIAAIIPSLMKGLWDGIIQGINAAAGPIGEAVKNLFKAFINLIVDGLGGLVEKIPGIGDDMKQKMDEWRNGLFEKLKPEEAEAKAKGFGEALSKGSLDGTELLGEGAKAAHEAALKPFENMEQEGENYGKDFIRGQSKGIKDGAPEIATSGNETMDALSAAMSQGTDGASDETIQKMVGELTSGMDSATPDMANSFSSMIGGAAEQGAGSVDWSHLLDGSGENIVGSLSGSVDGNSGEFISSMTNLGEGGNEGFCGALGMHSPSRVMIDNGKNITAGLAQGIKQGQSQVDRAMLQTATKTINVIKQQLNKFKDFGSQSTRQFAAGIFSMAETARSAARNMVSSSMSEFSGLYNKTYGYGQDVGRGFINGIDSKIADARQKNRELANTANEVPKKLKINSPSKLYRSFGRSAGEGYIMGLGDHIKGVGKAARTMAEASIKATETPLKHIASILGNDIDVDPTIRPVMDLSNIKEGAKAINSLMPTGSVGLTFAAAGAVRGTSFRMTNEDVVAAVNNLRRDLNNLPSGDTFNVNGVTYDDGSNVAGAVRDLIRAAKVERRA